ncbi:mycothiol system anti-sigma-R factor [Corynebacterium mycetoides]|uniref:Mycothiol system anti-sigma-R factor n=1 Tax=Corynebacterium mycetoides TaxID=38302 RepID=A0A1G9QU27_9CORY|nr:zf-HC2 domain-containing protein [Corynebacterium mycetoides]SDM14504.1 mycothiol system anti-sigma-R factor [Corynebacterium mycetoides]
MGTDCNKCADAHRMLCELLDSGTTPQRAAEIREAIAACPECFSRYENELAARTIVQDCCGSAHAPDRLRDSIIASITTVSVSEVRYRG